MSTLSLRPEAQFRLNPNFAQPRYIPIPCFIPQSPRPRLTVTKFRAHALTETIANRKPMAATILKIPPAIRKHATRSVKATTPR